MFQGFYLLFQLPLLETTTKIETKVFYNFHEIINNVGIARTLNIVFDLPPPF
jgi:hypothetical protein